MQESAAKKPLQTCRQLCINFGRRQAIWFVVSCFTLKILIMCLEKYRNVFWLIRLPYVLVVFTLHCICATSAVRIVTFYRPNGEIRLTSTLHVRTGGYLPISAINKWKVKHVANGTEKWVNGHFSINFMKKLTFISYLKSSLIGSPT